MAIGIIQIGLKRLYDTAKLNHKKLYDTLNKRYGITVYDFYRDAADPKCPFDQSGKVQVYDFLKAKNHVKEEVFIKVIDWLSSMGYSFRNNTFVVPNRSKRMTNSQSATSMPSSAVSVATSNDTAPLLKSASA